MVVVVVVGRDVSVVEVVIGGDVSAVVVVVVGADVSVVVVGGDVSVVVVVVFKGFCVECDFPLPTFNDTFATTKAVLLVFNGTLLFTLFALVPSENL